MCHNGHVARRFHGARPFRTALALSLLAACGTTRSGRLWAEDATLLPSGSELARAARNAALDPLTWVPLAGAGLLSIDDLDEGLSDWAREHTPVFGSEEGAEEAGSRLRGVAYGSWWVSMLLTPSGDEPGPWLLDKAKGGLVEGAAAFAAGELTTGLKQLTGRDRPDGGEDGSFPSGHATAAAVYTTLTARNVDTYDLPDWSRWTLKGGLISLSAATAWSRVEAGKHYPTDVLVGAALGNFVASFVHDAFLGVGAQPSVSATVDALGEAWVVRLSWSR